MHQAEWSEGNSLPYPWSWMALKITFFVTFLCVGSAYGQADQQICAAPLRAALMTVKHGATNTQNRSAETAWQCSSQFSTHDEAINSGLDVGAVVYGVPLKVGARFDKKNTDAWKSENCSKSARSADYLAASYDYIREVAPGSMRAFSECIKDNRIAKALTCDISKAGVLEVKWRRNEGEPENAIPRVIRFMPSGGSCDRTFAKGEKVLEGGIGTPCTATPRMTFSVLTETTRGLCTAVLSYDTVSFTVAGKINLSDAKSIEADVVDFADGADVVTNGNKFTVSAAEIRINGNAKIRSIDGPRSARPAGDDGRSGGTVILQAKQVTGGGRLEVNLPGEDGIEGKAGNPGAVGKPGVGGAGNRPVWLQGCVGARNGTDGRPGDPGGNGGNGGRGGDGGNVVLAIESGLRNGAISRIEVINAGGLIPAGKGGAGGAAGSGGPGGAGGAGGAGGDGGCGGSDAGSNGPAGAPGQPGQRGADGSPGRV